MEVFHFIGRNCIMFEWENRWVQGNDRWLRALGDVSRGLRSLIPVCCVLEFAVRDFLGQKDMAIRSGCIKGHKYT